jgi:hypothetical protein
LPKELQGVYLKAAEPKSSAPNGERVLVDKEARIFLRDKLEEITVKIGVAILLAG